jgi:cell division protein ZipA
MDISIRDWMIIIGALLIVAVLLDGYRRMRNNPKNVRVALTPVPKAKSGEEDRHSGTELPNGGARVIGREHDADNATASGTNKPPLLTNAPLEAGPEPLAGLSAREQQPGETLDMLAGINDDTQTAPSAVDPEDSEVVMLHVVARDEAGFGGDDILEILLAFELRFGEMNFFHRHQQAAGRGVIQFSVANMLQPGVFDIDAMSGFSTPGLIFFATLPGPEDMMATFDLMVETAQGVAENLGGDMLDESRSVATRQTLEHMRQRIRDLERRMLAHSNRQG